ncbi:MAG: single-stranded DNA-binding protein [Clostridia bacterium]|nr:single-stranded DNA-binding protein [Clostridia bacterium]
MNKLVIIGNLTSDPKLRQVQGRDGYVSVCDFTVAVNRRNGRTNSNGQPEADFFRVTAWRGLGETCQKYLAKGRKAAVTGAVSCRTYTGTDGVTRASLEVTADDVEFLSPRQDGGQQSAASACQDPAPPAAYPQAAPQPQYQQQQIDTQSGFVQVDDEELPF